jgi:hypothetical protein
VEVWQGQFEYDKADYGFDTVVKFELHVKFENGSLEGITTDPEFAELSDLLVMVKGFVEGDHISFVKSYPLYYESDENGKSSINESKKGHDVVYDGYFDPTVNKWTGHWEILTDEIKVDVELYEQHYVGGIWELELPFDSLNNFENVS